MMAAVLLLIAAIVLLWALHWLFCLVSDPCEKCGRPVLHLRPDSIHCKHCETMLEAEL